MINLMLNESQANAVLHNKGPMMVLSGPGSGKTTVITYRVKNLIENMSIPPKDILVITFTKAASEEMKNRFYKICNCDRQVAFATFHSYFFRIIRDFYGYDLNNVLNETEKINIIKKIVLKNQISFNNYEEFVQEIISEIALVKNELINYTVFNSKVTDTNSFKIIYNEYEQIKQQQNKIDFDDMLIYCYNLLTKNENVRQFWKNKYKYILIDEFQDINRVQYECVKMLTSKEGNIFVVGDDDQSIYGFRGSRPEFLLSFPNDFNNTKQVVLNVNHRSTDQIISLCNNIINDNKTRYVKNIVGTGKRFKSPVLLKAYDIYDEANKITQKIQKLKKQYDLEQIAIIYRTNLQARAIIEKLMDNNIDYQLKDVVPTVYDHFIAKDIISYINLALNRKDNRSFFNIANKPKRFLNKDMLLEIMDICKEETSAIEYLYCKTDLKTWQLEKVNDLLFHLGQIKNKCPQDAIQYILKNVGYNEYLEDYANFKKIKINGLIEIVDELLDASKEYKTLDQYLNHIEDFKQEMINKNKDKATSKGVVLTTMHSAKGLEFDVVFVITCVEGVIPHEKSKSNQEIEEERRLFYVALTRAKQLLYISIIKTKYDNNMKHSRFLDKLIKVKR